MHESDDTCCGLTGDILETGAGDFLGVPGGETGADSPMSSSSDSRPRAAARFDCFAPFSGVLLPVPSTARRGVPPTETETRF